MREVRLLMDGPAQSMFCFAVAFAFLSHQHSRKRRRAACSQNDMETGVPIDLWILLIAAPFLGSFADCVAQRLPVHRPLVAARSQCDHCAVALAPIELVPVVSWIALGGKCRHCLARISPVYAVAELSAAGLALWCAAVVPSWLIWPTAALGWTLLTLALMDFYHLLLADILLLPLLLLGIAVNFGISEAQGVASLGGAVIGYGGAFAIRKIYRLARGRDGLGMGDVKLLAASGAWISWDGLPSVLFIASATALAACLALRLLDLRLSGDERIPFGIFLAIGLWIVWLHGPIRFGFA
jgi:leader peptidase (prepilin peptidase)/N-methyltransferase